MPELTKEQLTTALERLKAREAGVAKVLADPPDDTDEAAITGLNAELAKLREDIAAGEAQLQEIETEEQLAAATKRAEEGNAALDAYDQLRRERKAYTATPELRRRALAEVERRNTAKLLGYDPS